MILEPTKRLNLAQQIVYLVIQNQEAPARNNKTQENRAKMQETIP